MTKKRLLMTFKTSSDRKVSVAVDNPVDGVEEATIVSAMDLIIEKDIFMPNFGETLAEKVDAKIVVTDTTEFDLV